MSDDAPNRAWAIEEAARAALLAIERGESFEYLDNVIAPALRLALTRTASKGEDVTRDDIIRMAREAGSIDSEEVIETVWRAFSAAEREACAKVCEEVDVNPHVVLHHAVVCAAAIRARGNHG